MVFSTVVWGPRGPFTQEFERISVFTLEKLCSHNNVYVNAFRSIICNSKKWGQLRCPSAMSSYRKGVPSRRIQRADKEDRPQGMMLSEDASHTHWTTPEDGKEPVLTRGRGGGDPKGK